MASSGNSDDNEPSMQSATNNPSSNPSSTVSSLASSIPAPRTSGSGIGLVRGGTGIHFGASRPSNIFTRNVVVQGASARPVYTWSETTPPTIRPFTAKRSHDAFGQSSHPPSAGGGPAKRPFIGAISDPFGHNFRSYPNQRFPVFDPARLAVNLPLDPPELEKVVTHNAKEQTTQGVEAAAAASKPRGDVRRVIFSYPNPEFPIFDPKWLTVDLPIDPSPPHPPLVSDKDGADDNVQPQKGQHEEVVEDIAKEQAPSGGEAADAATEESHATPPRGEAAAAAAEEPHATIRDDVVPVVRRNSVPDLNLPSLEAEEESR